MNVSLLSIANLSFVITTFLDISKLDKYSFGKFIWVKNLKKIQTTTH